MPLELEAAAETAYAAGPARPATIPVIAATTAIRAGFDRKRAFVEPSPTAADEVTASAPEVMGAGPSADEDPAAA